MGMDDIVFGAPVTSEELWTNRKLCTPSLPLAILAIQAHETREKEKAEGN